MAPWCFGHKIAEAAGRINGCGSCGWCGWHDWRRLDDRSTPRATLAAIPAACGDASSAADEGITTDSAGVTIVTHGETDVPAGLAFLEEFRLGGSETRPEESFYRVNARSIGIDEAGRLHVLDRDAREVIVFDDEGRHPRTLGGAGGGPGELGLPTAVAALATHPARHRTPGRIR